MPWNDNSVGLPWLSSGKRGEVYAKTLIDFCIPLRIIGGTMSDEIKHMLCLREYIISDGVHTMWLYSNIDRRPGQMEPKLLRVLNRFCIFIEKPIDNSL